MDEGDHREPGAYQDYIVVDIETTGSWASGDRKPRLARSRSAIIRSSTSGTPCSIRRVPFLQISCGSQVSRTRWFATPGVFASVADSFLGFIGDGFFVAHNENFDYGFIAYEFSRLDRKSLPEASHLRRNTAALSRP